MSFRHGQGSGMTTLAEFKQELHGLFHSLKRKSYILQAALSSQGMNTPLNATGDNTVIPIPGGLLNQTSILYRHLKHANKYFLLQLQERINSSSTTEVKNELVIKCPTFLL
jgi:hypothetical protein